MNDTRRKCIFTIGSRDAVETTDATLFMTSKHIETYIVDTLAPKSIYRDLIVDKKTGETRNCWNAAWMISGVEKISIRDNDKLLHQMALRHSVMDVRILITFRESEFKRTILSFILCVC